MPIPLSQRAEQLVGALFAEPERSRIVERLVREVAENIPFHEMATPEEMDRVRFAIMKLIVQNRKNEESAFRNAQIDWRDLFVAAGFANSATEHELWCQNILDRNGSGR